MAPTELGPWAPLSLTDTINLRGVEVVFRADVVIPALAPYRRRRLARLLPADHSWQRIVSAASQGEATPRSAESPAAVSSRSRS